MATSKKKTAVKASKMKQVAQEIYDDVLDNEGNKREFDYDSYSYDYSFDDGYDDLDDYRDVANSMRDW